MGFLRHFDTNDAGRSQVAEFSGYFAFGGGGNVVRNAGAGGTAAIVAIHVQNVSPKGGTLRLGLYDQAGYPDDASTPVASVDVPAQLGETVITLTNIVPGTHAIETFQDINSNNKMDTTWFGFPLAPGMNVQTLHLQNSISPVAAK